MLLLHVEGSYFYFNVILTAHHGRVSGITVMALCQLWDGHSTLSTPVAVAMNYVHPTCSI